MLWYMASYATMRRYLPPAVAIALIAVLSVTIIYFRHYSPYKVTREQVGNPEILLSLSGVEIVGRSQGERIWSFKTTRADVWRGQVRTALLGIHDGKLYSDGKVVASVSAGSAIYNSATGDVEVTGGVGVASVRGYRAAAQSARWSGYLRRLTCPGRVSFRTDGSELVGQNLVADARSEEVTLDKGRMVVNMSEVVELGKEGPAADGGKGQ